MLTYPRVYQAPPEKRRKQTNPKTPIKESEHRHRGFSTPVPPTPVAEPVLDKETEEWNAAINEARKATRHEQNAQQDDMPDSTTTSKVCTCMNRYLL